MLIRIHHSFLNRSINIIMDCYYPWNAYKNLSLLCKLKHQYHHGWLFTMKCKLQSISLFYCYNRNLTCSHISLKIKIYLGFPNSFGIEISDHMETSNLVAGFYFSCTPNLPGAKKTNPEKSTRVVYGLAINYHCYYNHYFQCGCMVWYVVGISVLK